MALYGRTWTGQQKNMWLATGIFELLLGSGFLVAAFYARAARFGFLLTTAVLWAVAFPLLFAWWRTRAKLALEKTGVSGTATVVGFTQTGVTVNDQPRIKLDLLVRIPGREPFHVHQAELVPISLLGLLTAGATLPVKVDPKDPEPVLIEWEQAGSAMPDVSQLFQQLAGQGLQIPATAPASVATPAPAAAPTDGWRSARATVLDFDDTGAGTGDDLSLRFKLRVSGASTEPYELEHTELIPRNVAGRLVKGQSFAAKIDPGDPSRLRLDWEGS